ncbi:Cytochrome P450 [Mycena venus]|uniref:Cytochrome P450 n=1 Tax=Mycena venus TaxID=2733690 RepID=A0A8H6YWE4_9AGAR|nr:Cytochrome P450 [Mycena venus]
MDIAFSSGAFLGSVIIIYWVSRRFASKGTPIPGPPSHPLVGHTFQVPIIKTWKYFERLSHQYGPIIKVTLTGHDFVVLSNAADAEELASIHKSTSYESNNLRLSLLPYGDMLKRQRAAFHQMLQPRVVGGYEGMQYNESLRLLVDLATSPTQYYRHFQRFPASLVFSLAFGEAINDDDKDLAAALEILNTFVRDINPNSHLVDTFPVLDLLPDFLSPWRAEARMKHQREIDLYGRLSLGVKTRMEKEAGLECFAARLWEQQAKLGLSDEEIFYIAGSAFIAGTDTSSITLLWFVMAMALYPETMKKAQREIDAVFDSATLPDFSRMHDMPYCFALVKEVIRWHPAAPLSIPHYSDAEDQYKGYTIRKGTTVVPSIWHMHHNEEEFPDSYTFDPERFLSKTDGTAVGGDSLAEGHYGFGFGRRKCPGQHMATKSTWIAIVRVLWAFNIETRQDATGNLMKIDPEDCTSGLTV